MHPFVTQGGSAQQGVHDGVDQDVAVAVAGQPVGVGYFHAAQDQPAACFQGVGVEPDARAEFGKLKFGVIRLGHDGAGPAPRRRCSNRPAISRSSGVVTFRFS